MLITTVKKLDHNLLPKAMLVSIFSYFVGFFVCLFCFVFFRAAPAAYGGPQARGQIRAIATSLHQSHSNAGSEPHLQPTQQLTAMLDP